MCAAFILRRCGRSSGGSTSVEGPHEGLLTAASTGTSEANARRLDRYLEICDELPPRVDGGVKTASPEIATAGAEMGSGATEDDAAAVVSSGRDHRRVGCSCVDRGDDDQLVTTL